MAIEALPIDLPFQEAIDYFGSKGLQISPNSWRDVWQDGNARAFTVARVTSTDVLADIKSAMQKAIADGTTLRDFKKSLRPQLEAKGWYAPEGEKAVTIGPDGLPRKRLNGWRLDTIFNTNVQTAYSVGRYTQQMEVAAARPYWQYHAVLDAATRPSHAAMDRKIYDHRHPIWAEWYPPNGFFCRCFVTTLSDDDVKSRGLTVETTGVNVHPDEGWRYNVGQTGLDAWQPDRQVPPQISEGTATPKPLKVKNRKEMVDFIKEKLGPSSIHGIENIHFRNTASFMSTNSNGTITISTRRFPDLDMVPSRDLLKALRKLGKEPLSFNEEYCLESLWHEINHNRQIWTVRYPFPDPRTTLMETVNQWVSRRTYQEMLDKMGGFVPIHQEAIKAAGYGYSTMVKNFDALLSKLGVDEQATLDRAYELLLTHDRTKYADPISEFLANKIGHGDKASRIMQVLDALDLSCEGFGPYMDIMLGGLL